MTFQLPQTMLPTMYSPVCGFLFMFSWPVDLPIILSYQGSKIPIHIPARINITNSMGLYVCEK